MKIVGLSSFILFVVFFLSSCNTSSLEFGMTSIATNDSLLIIDVDNANKKNVVYYSEFFSRVSAIILESDVECLIGHIDKMQTWNDFIFILDSNIGKSLFVFNRKGEFVRRVGCIGQGVGEYASVNDFTIEISTGLIYLLDNALQKINVYCLETGNFVKSISLNKKIYIRSFHLYCNNGLYTDAYFYDSSKLNYLLQKIDTTKKENNEKYLTVDEYNKGWSNLFYIENTAFYESDSKDKVYFIQQFMDTIIAIKNNEIFPYAVVKSKDFISKEDLYSMGKNIGNQFPLDEITKKNKIWCIRDLVEHNNYLYFRCWKKNYQLSVLYDNVKKQTYVIGFEKNDILYDKDVKKGINQRFANYDSKGVYVFIRNEDISVFSEYAKENLLLLSAEQLCEVMTLKEDSNPVILYYEFKK